MVKSDKIKVLCVDDSATIREVLSDIIAPQADMELVATAASAMQARELIKRYDPDVLTLDIKMPGIHGLDFLERLMRLRPMPVLMVSSSTQRGAAATRRALELGAVDVVGKPELGIRHGLHTRRNEITDKIRNAARSPLWQARQPRHEGAALRMKAPLVASDELIAIGASTGGTEAIREVLEPLPVSTPPIVITQHMPGGFTRAFAKRLNQSCQVRVKEAEDGESLLAGHAYIAPGDKHLKVDRSGPHYVARLDDGPEVNRHRPAVDVLFHSVARHGGRNATGVLLTGMGRDGAAGLLAMREAGARTIAQDEASSVIFGMPREAIELGAALEIVPLAKIAPRLEALTAASHRTPLRPAPIARPGRELATRAATRGATLIDASCRAA
jgi:two-component system chemotaxis response regulator CheB